MRYDKTPQEVLSNFKDEQFLTLVFKYMDQVLDSSENEKLQRRLKEDESCRDVFVALLIQLQQIKESAKGIGSNIDLSNSISDTQILNELRGDTVEDYDLALKLLSQDESEAPTIVIPKEESEKELIQKVVYTKPSRRISKLSIYSAIFSTAAVALIVLFVRFAPVRYENSFVGTLSNSIEAVWENVSGDLVEGCSLYSGPMKLESGFAKIKMGNGAVVVVQGPSQFSLESVDQIYLQEGRLVVRIDTKDDSTFVVRSPHGTIVDFGTEFGVQVAGLETMTHVYQGRVELRSGSNPVRYEHSLRLTKNQAGKADTSGNVNVQQGVSELFVRSEEFDIKLKATNGSAYHRWLAHSLELRRDPDLAAYYTFEKDMANPDILVNQALCSLGDLNGQLSGANGDKPQWSQGRFLEKNALTFDHSQLQFVEVSPDMRLCINGPITLAAWIYCESDDDGGHIVSNRTVSDSSSPCNYQFGYRGKEKERSKYMHLARKLSSDDDKNQINSKQLPDDLKGWILVAVTHDNKTLKYYVNGKLFDTQYWPRKNELVEAGLKIGSDFRSYDKSSFNGKIDEIVILRRRMSESEIGEMYKAGKP